MAPQTPPARDNARELPRFGAAPARNGGRRGRDAVHPDDEEDEETNRLASRFDADGAYDPALRASDEREGIERQGPDRLDHRVVCRLLENIAPHRAGEVAGFDKPTAMAMIKQGLAELVGDGAIRKRDKAGDWINRQPRHNATGGVAASSTALAPFGGLTSGGLGELAKAVATAAQVAGLQEQVAELTAERDAREATIKDLGERLAALEATAKKK